MEGTEAVHLEGPQGLRLRKVLHRAVNQRPGGGTQQSFNKVILKKQSIF